LSVLGLKNSDLTLVLLFFLVFTLFMVKNVEMCNASGTIYIRANGLVEGTTNISNTNNVLYTFVSNISGSIVVERSHIIIDGANFTLQGDGRGNGFSLTGRINVTITNLNIRSFQCGIYLDHSSSIIIKTNISGNCYGIQFFCSSENLLRENRLFDNKWSLSIWGWTLPQYTQYIEQSNTINNKPIVYLHDQKNLTINFTTFPSIGFLGIINSANVKIQNLSLTSNYQGLLVAFTKDSTISYNNFTNNEYGIFLFSSQNITVTRNLASNNYLGIECHTSSDNNIISENIVTSNIKGVGCEFSSNNTIKANNITANQAHGILLYSTINCTITENTIAKNKIGIGFSPNSNNNIMVRNNITENSECGVQLLQAAGNTFYHNNFLNNTKQVTLTGLSLANVWSKNYPFGGNFWSDYNGADQFSGLFQNESGSDGIGDVPYMIDVNNKDNFPLMISYPPLRGDLNRDGAVDGKDIAVVAKAFGTILNHERWNPQADLNQDNRIDGLDILIVAKNWRRKN